ncbi:MAG: rsbV [Firmicutes bacterium]|nr:rsbV [Bacillota bacterium]
MCVVQKISQREEIATCNNTERWIDEMTNVMIIANKALGPDKQMVIREVNIADDQVYVDLSGSIYVEDAAEVLKKFIDFFGHGYRSFYVDMSEVDYIDSFGLGVLFFIHSRSMQNGGKLRLKGLRGQVRELFKVIRLDKIIEILP